MVHAAYTPGHVQYDGNNRGLGIETAAEWYLSGLAQAHVVMFDSWFAVTAKLRSPLRKCAKFTSPPFGWAQLFYAGNERALTSEADRDVMNILS